MVVARKQIVRKQQRQERQERQEQEQQYNDVDERLLV